HVLLLDVHPPGQYERNSIHEALWKRIGTEHYISGSERPLTVLGLGSDRPLFVTASYIGGSVAQAFINQFAVGEQIPDMPLFLTQKHHILVPLEAAYRAAWEDVPSQYQDALRTSS